MRVVLQLSVLLNISISQYPEQRHFYNGEQPRGGCSRDSARGYTGSLKWREKYRSDTAFHYIFGLFEVPPPEILAKEDII